MVAPRKPLEVLTCRHCGKWIRRSRIDPSVWIHRSGSLYCIAPGIAPGTVKAEPA